MRYLHHFFSLNCAHDLLPFFVGCKKRAAKEVTESFGIYQASLDNFGDLKDWVIICVGDGKRPRTGAVVRFLSKASMVYSVDPALDVDWFEKILPEKFKLTVRDMILYPKKAEELVGGIDCYKRHCLILACHSHSNMVHNIKIPRNYSSLNVIEMPCCKSIPSQFFVKEFAEKTKLKTYVDNDIMSPKNQLYIWSSI